MLWINPLKSLKKDNLDFQFERIKVPFCDEIIKFVSDNSILYSKQGTKPVLDYKELLVEYIEGIERDFQILDNIIESISSQRLEIKKGVRQINNVDCSLHFLNNEYALVFFAGHDRRYDAYKYGIVTFEMGKKRNHVIDSEIIFTKESLDLDYNVCNYFSDLFALMNNASNVSELDEIHEDVEKTILKIFRVENKYDLHRNSDFNDFYGIEPFVFLKDKYQTYIKNKIKLELTNKGLNFNSDHIELVRIDRVLKSLINEKKEHIELLGEEIYFTRCDELEQERTELILKLDMEESQLEIMLV